MGQGGVEEVEESGKGAVNFKWPCPVTKHYHSMMGRHLVMTYFTPLSFLT